MWNGPRYFVDAETEVNRDGLHFYWPNTIGKVNTVINVHTLFKASFIRGISKFISHLDTTLVKLVR